MKQKRPLQVPLLKRDSSPCSPVSFSEGKESARVFSSPKRQDENAEQERELIQGIIRGDSSSFETVVDLYIKPVHSFSYSILKNRQSAEDITQDTFLRLWNKAELWNETGQLKSWLLRIAHNLCMDALRSQKEEICIETNPESIPPSHAKQVTLLVFKEREDTVRTALFSLPERQRTALMLVYYEECTNKEAADIMGISAEAVESLLSRGKSKLRVLLSGSYKSLLEE